MKTKSWRSKKCTVKRTNVICDLIVQCSHTIKAEEVSCSDSSAEFLFDEVRCPVSILFAACRVSLSVILILTVITILSAV